jgi:hypothetical protein
MTEDLELELPLEPADTDTIDEPEDTDEPFDGDEDVEPLEDDAAPDA